MSNNGYFLVYRKLFSHEIGENPLTVALWIRLLSEASYENKEVFWDTQSIQVKRGQIITSIDKLSKWLGVSRRTTKRILDALQMVQQINIKTTNKYTVISIQNYDKYQILPNKRTSNGTTNAQQTPTTKEYKEVKEYNKEEDTSINYLLNIPSNDLAEFSLAFLCTDRQIINKAQSLYDYCESKGKSYKDYKAFLRNALRKDFGDRLPVAEHFAVPEDISEEQRLKNIKKIAQIKKDLLKRIN